MSASNIQLNVIPLNPEWQNIRCSFYKERRKGREMVPLNPYECPKKVDALYDQAVYTDFGIHDDADTTLSVELSDSPRFAKHYLNHLIYKFFEDKARLRGKNFVNNIELYFLREQDKKQGLVIFDRFVLRGTWGRITDGAELTVMYRGTMRVWRHSILSYDGSTKDFSRVVYDGHIHRYEDLLKSEQVNRAEVYPVINRDVAQALGLENPAWKSINKVKRHAKHVDAFYEKWINSKEFKKQFRPSQDGYLMVEDEQLRRINHRAANLLFGKGVIEKEPYKGMNRGGPYDPPRTSHIELFFIIDEQDTVNIGNRLYTYLNKGLNHFPGLSKFSQIPVKLRRDHIQFRNNENPFPEVKEKLRKMEFDEDVQYGAIYISPIDKNEKDPEKHRVYYRIKEELLRYNITSQVINRHSVTDSSFAFYLPNIAVALLAKLNGTPWTLEQKEKKELVIGVGAFSPYRFRKTYLGSAFCFSSDGDFRGFDSFKADDTLKLAGSFQKAVKQFKEENNDVERVVIHFYKKMSKKEARIIKNALRELKLDVPLVILTIHKTGSTDLVLTDVSRPHRLPLSGIYYRSGRRQFLLCNNARFDGGENLRAYPYPIKVYFDVWDSEQKGDDRIKEDLLEQRLQDEEWVHELLEQVYQFSRLNWQTVTTGSMPVSILYPEMVAEKFPYFEEDIIPDFGKRNFWFL